MPKVSIIIPVYKVPEKYLRQCIESCLGQTMADIEVIAVDDGSPDDCGRILDEYAAADTRLKVIHKENGGVVSARNAGYEAVTSPWHMYVDGDDYLSPEACACILDAIKEYQDVDVLIFRPIMQLGNVENKEKFKGKYNDKTVLISGEKECRDFSKNVIKYSYALGSPYCKLLNTEYARKHKIHNDPSIPQGVEGVDFSLRCCCNANRILLLNEFLYHYVYIEGSDSKSVNYKHSFNLIEGLNIIESKILQFPDKEKFLPSLFERTVYVLLAIAMNIYFHPTNKDGLRYKNKNFSNLIKNNPLIQKSIAKSPYKWFDRQRKVALFALKTHQYWLLQPIANLKQIFFKLGKYNY